MKEEKHLTFFGTERVNLHSIFTQIKIWKIRKMNDDDIKLTT